MRTFVIGNPTFVELMDVSMMDFVRHRGDKSVRVWDVELVSVYETNK